MQIEIDDKLYAAFRNYLYSKGFSRTRGSMQTGLSIVLSRAMETDAIGLDMMEFMSQKGSGGKKDLWMDMAKNEIKDFTNGRETLPGSM